MAQFNLIVTDTIKRHVIVEAETVEEAILYIELEVKDKVGMFKKKYEDYVEHELFVEEDPYGDKGNYQKFTVPNGYLRKYENG